MLIQPMHKGAKRLSPGWRTIFLGTGILAAITIGAAAGEAQLCPGDCDGDTSVTTDEVSSGVDIALGQTPTESCVAFDSDDDGIVSVDELVAGRATELGLCPLPDSPPAPSTERAAGVVTLTVGQTAGPAGSTRAFLVSVDYGGFQSPGLQTDIAYDPLTPIRSCSRVPGVTGSLLSAQQPPGCSPGVNCAAFRVILIDFSLNPLPEGPLFTCTVDINPAAPLGTYPLTQSLVVVSSLVGQRLPVTWVDGAVGVGPDGDGDGVIDAADNCVDDRNPDQSNLDGDSLGDLCDAVDSLNMLEIRSARLRPDTSGRGDIGFMKLRAVLDASSIGDGMIADLLSDGVEIEVHDGNDFATTLTFDRCELRHGGARIRCRGGHNGLALFVLHLNRPRYDVRVSAPRLSAMETGSTAPVGPVDVTVHSAAIDHAANIAACRPARLNSLACTFP